jgi:hypothetical protein
VATAAWAFVDKIRGALREKGIKGAKITFPNGTRMVIVTEKQLLDIVKQSASAAPRKR